MSDAEDEEEKAGILGIYDAELARLVAEKQDDAPLHAWRATRSIVYGTLHDAEPPPGASADVRLHVLDRPKRERKAAATARVQAEAVKLAATGKTEEAFALLARPIERPLHLDRETRKALEMHSLAQKHHQVDLWERADAMVATAGVTETGRT